MLLQSLLLLFVTLFIAALAVAGSSFAYDGKCCKGKKEGCSKEKKEACAKGTYNRVVN